MGACLRGFWGGVAAAKKAGVGEWVCVVFLWPDFGAGYFGFSVCLSSVRAAGWSTTAKKFAVKFFPWCMFISIFWK